ncbi:unnamed protein product [Lactuca saligna]|uniref:Uncharacterized protein n=1 Tax=Lactuca saligna TaxID=75948 RepID=A0AA35VBW2_LACSI|nr:unnamed protein product [Lactuca saligna]
MAYSTGSSSTNDIVVVTRNRDNNLCNCRHPPKVIVERISMFNKNPAHRFCNCVDSLVEMAAKKYTSYTGRLERRVAMLKNLNVEITTAKDIIDGEFAMAVEDNKQLGGEFEVRDCYDGVCASFWCVADAKIKCVGIGMVL